MNDQMDQMDQMDMWAMLGIEKPHEEEVVITTKKSVEKKTAEKKAKKIPAEKKAKKGSPKEMSRAEYIKDFRVPEVYPCQVYTPDGSMQLLTVDADGDFMDQVNPNYREYIAPINAREIGSNNPVVVYALLSDKRITEFTAKRHICVTDGRIYEDLFDDDDFDVADDDDAEESEGKIEKTISASEVVARLNLREPQPLPENVEFYDGGKYVYVVSGVPVYGKLYISSQVSVRELNGQLQFVANIQDATTKTTTVVKPEEELVKLPVTVELEWDRIQLTPEQFSGKNELKISEVKEHIATQFRVAKNSHLIYVSERNLIICKVSIPGKGSVLPAAVKKLLDRPVPVDVIEEIRQFFISRLPYEAQSFVYYDIAKKKYFARNIIGAEASCIAVKVSDEDANYRATHPDCVVCLDIHSHGELEPFFSAVDYHAMLNGYPITYGVFGSCGNKLIFGYMGDDEQIHRLSIDEVVKA